jgi:zinc-binding alcohol dehydrogenase family protein
LYDKNSNRASAAGQIAAPEEAPKDGRSMRAVAYLKPLPIADEQSLIDVELERPKPSGRDLLVAVKAVSVNPVDVKRRVRDDPGGTPKILGYDAAGVVVETGSDARLFRHGDAVFYAGAVGRQGANAEFHLVDERIVGRKPGALSFAEAAALPLTSLTAWELMFERIGVRRGADSDRRTLLIVGGAGGVGSIATQFARRLTGLTAIATASRQETRAWCDSLGAAHVIDHSRPLQPQIEALGLPSVDIILSLTASDRHLPELAKILAPQGHIGVIDDPKGFDFGSLRSKSASVHFEFMFSRSAYGTPDIDQQHRILNAVADLVDAGTLRTTMTELVGRIDAANLRRAHAIVESGRAVGKIVLEGFV